SFLANQCSLIARSIAPLRVRVCFQRRYLLRTRFARVYPISLKPRIHQRMAGGFWVWWAPTDLVSRGQAQMFKFAVRPLALDSLSSPGPFDKGTGSFSYFSS